MANEFVIEQGEDFKKELKFDKFMDEIVETEADKKNLKESDGEGEFGKKIANLGKESPANRTRYVRK